MTEHSIYIIVFLLIVCPALAAPQMIISIQESGKVTSYYDMYWVVNVHGDISVYNPFNNSFDYVKFAYDLGTLTIVENSSSHYLRPDQIYIPYIGPGENITISYQIKGVSAYDPMVRNKSVLNTAMLDDDASLYTFMISNIRKAPVENESIDRGGIKSVEKRRLVIVSLENPSDLNQNVTSIRVIKTPEQDPNNELDSWSFPDTAEPIIIGPHETWTQEIIDYNSSEGEVYWLSTEAVTDTVPILVGDHLIKRFSEEDLYSVANDSLTEEELLHNLTDYLEHLMYIKKTVSKSVLVPGDLVTVNVKVNNFAPISREINLREEIPDGFRISYDGGANSSSETVLGWKKSVNRDSTTLFKYELEYIDNQSLGLDHFEPAVLKYANETLFSERIPFIRQYVPEKKIFIQKKLRYGLNDEVVVQIQLQNLGESSIEGLYVKEFLGANDEFREISVAPEGIGRWHIPVLEKGQMWEVTYVTNENEAINLLPEVYGVDKKIVLKTLVFENVVRNEWIAPALKIVEIAAPVFILSFLIFYIVYHRRVNSKKVRGIRKLGKTIHKLKKDTDLEPKDSIDLLIRESRNKKDIPSVGGYSITGRAKGTTRDVAHDNLEKLKKIEDDIQ